VPGLGFLEPASAGTYQETNAIIRNGGGGDSLNGSSGRGSIRGADYPRRRGGSQGGARLRIDTGDRISSRGIGASAAIEPNWQFAIPGRSVLLSIGFFRTAATMHFWNKLSTAALDEVDGLAGVITPVPSIMRRSWASALRNLPEAPLREASWLASMLDTLATTGRSI